METTRLYRPVGLKEMELIAELHYNAFPSRLDWQPIFYPVTNQQYAEQLLLNGIQLTSFQVLLELLRLLK